MDLIIKYKNTNRDTTKQFKKEFAVLYLAILFYKGYTSRVLRESLRRYFNWQSGHELSPL